VLLAVVSAKPGLAVDAYRTDLLPASELGGGCGASFAGIPGANVGVAPAAFVLAGRFGLAGGLLAAGA